MRVARAGAPFRATAVLEEADVVAVRGSLIAIEDVVRRLVDLVHRLLDDAKTENPHVEVRVARGVGRDARDVVNALQSHADPSHYSMRTSAAACPKLRRGRLERSSGRTDTEPTAN